MTTINTHPALYPALTRWGYTDDSCPQAPRPALWETARLAVQTGHWLALHTQRPAPAPEPPEADPARRDTVVDGWVQVMRGWRPIVPCRRPQGPGPVSPEAVARRFTSGPSAMPTAIRQVIDKQVRVLHYPEDLPDGVALTVGTNRLPREWWGYVLSGWLATLTGHAGQSAIQPLPPVPSGPWDRRYLREAMEWLSGHPELRGVHRAFTSTRPKDVAEAVSSLGYDATPSPPEATVLARLLPLYATACRRADEPVIELVQDVRHGLRGVD